MKQRKKGNRWHVGMNAHIGTDNESGLVAACIDGHLRCKNQPVRVLAGVSSPI